MCFISRCLTWSHFVGVMLNTVYGHMGGTQTPKEVTEHTELNSHSHLDAADMGDTVQKFSWLGQEEGSFSVFAKNSDISSPLIPLRTRTIIMEI